MKVLNQDKEIQFIFHLSDIHIRLYHRLDDEYEHVFQQMYNLLETSQKKNEECLVVLTGDILHNKNDLSPECILTTLRFLNKLSSYYPTLFIAGNHDTLLNNLNRIDSLSAILVENKNPHLHYLKYSGFYRYGNLLFGVSSLLDNTMTTINDMKTTTLKKVALYHGGVGKFQTNKGFVMEGIPLHTFDGYDVVMLGDIHKHQYLDKNKRIAYAGSMIAQNFGETDLHHGVLKWDMRTYQSTFINLSNPYRYCEAILRGNRLLMDGVEQDILGQVILPEKCRLKVMINGQKTTQDLHHLGLIREKYPLVQIQENRVLTTDHSLTPTTENENNPLSVIHGYFNSLPSWPEKQKLMDIILGYFKNNTTRKTTSHFEILFIEFHYMFGYGPHNQIDFSRFKKNQTVGIFGMNSAGKSTLIDIILFLLYGNITRYKHGQSVPHEVIHFHQKNSSGTIRFRSHNFVYEIQKKMTRTKTNKIKVDEKLFKILPDGTKLDLSEEQRRKTDKFVVSQIGTPAQFLFTNIFLQAHDQSFRSMSPKERKDFLYDILELSQLEEHYQKHFERWKENKHLLVRLEKEIETLHVRQETISQTRDTLQTLRDERQTYEDHQKKLQSQIREKLSQKKHCPPSLESLDRMRQQIQECQEETIQWETNIQCMEKEKETEPLVVVDGAVLEKTRKYLRELSTRVMNVPMFDPLFFQQHQDNVHRPTLEDVGCFRHEVYDRFLKEYHEKTQQNPIPDSMEAMRIEKEKLLSSLYPGEERPEDTPTLETKLKNGKTTTHRLSTWKKKLALYENERVQLETQWQKRWKEWEKLQQEPDKAGLLSGLQFHDKCASCAHNQATLRECLSDIEEHKKKRALLLHEITPSQKRHEILLEKIKKARQTIGLLEEKEEIMRTLHNRSVKEMLKKLQQEMEEANRRSKEQKDYQQMKEIWERTKNVADERQKVVQHNQEIEHQIQEKEQELSIMEEEWDRNNKYQGLLIKTQSQWKDSLSRLEKLQEKLVEQEQWEANRKYNTHIDQWVQGKETEETELQANLSRNMEKIIITQQELGELEKKAHWKQEKEEQYQETIGENNFLQKLLSILHRDGLPMYFMEQYLPSIETRINELIRPFLNEKQIVLRKEQKKESVDILLSVRTLGIETVYLGGMEGFIVDASIKEVLAEISMQCKSNFFLIDEGISALDKKQMENLDQFFHFLEERHPHVFIISHLNQAQHIVRHSLNILKEGDYSKIEYV